MSKELVCKNTATKLSAADVTYVKESDDWGQTWKYTATEAAVASCGAIVFDPRMVPMGSGAFSPAGVSSPPPPTPPTQSDSSGNAALPISNAGVTVGYSGLLTMVVALVIPMIW